MKGKVAATGAVSNKTKILKRKQITTPTVALRAYFLDLINPLALVQFCVQVFDSQIFILAATDFLPYIPAS